MENLKCLSENDLKDIQVYCPNSIDELVDCLLRLLSYGDAYNSSIYATSLAAQLTFDFFCVRFGFNGSSEARADLDFLRRTRGYKDGFRILNYSNLFYPQYFNEIFFPTKETLLKERKEYYSQRAKTLLSENLDVTPEVKRHWKMIARLR